MSVTLEAGKFYRTRGGRKMGPAWTDGTQPYPWCAPSEHGEHWFRDDGTTCTTDEGADEHDLVAEWVDEPAT